VLPRWFVTDNSTFGGALVVRGDPGIGKRVV
jgi:hypothetical protein